jgi:hypothetical protein
MVVVLDFVALVFPVGDAVLELVACDGAADYAEDGWGVFVSRGWK